jgi:hypothetical protein
VVPVESAAEQVPLGELQNVIDGNSVPSLSAFVDEDQGKDPSRRAREHERRIRSMNSNREKWIWLVAALMLLVGVGQAAAQEKPNIVVVWGDDIGYWNISAYNQGMMGYQTPRHPTSIASPKRERCLRIGMDSRVVPPVAPPLSPVSRRSAPV